MTSEYGMPKLEQKVKDALEVAYQKLLEASEDMGILDYVEADKIADARKHVLRLLQGELRL